MGTEALDPDELRSFARERFANYKTPKQIEMLDELSMLPIGKVDRKNPKARNTPWQKVPALVTTSCGKPKRFSACSRATRTPSS